MARAEAVAPIVATDEEISAGNVIGGARLIPAGHDEPAIRTGLSFRGHALSKSNRQGRMRMFTHLRHAVAIFTLVAGVQATPAWCADANEEALHRSVASDGFSPELAPSKEPSSSPSYEGSGQPVPQSLLETPADIWRLLELRPLDSSIGIETIIGADNRNHVGNTSVFPYRAIVLVTSDAGRCTGWLYGKDVVATAGHCVHSGGNGGAWYRNLRVYPGRNGSSTPFGSCGARRLYSVEGWTRSRNEQYDYGAIKLDCTVGNNTGWLGYFWQTAPLNGLSSEVAGYPGDKPLQQWTHRDSVRATSGLQVFYQNDTVPGNSGGPVFYNRPNCGFCSMNIHAYGLHGASPHNNNNHGTRITRPVFDNLTSWRNAN